MRTGQGGVRRSRLTLEEMLPIASYGAKASWPSGFQLYQRGTRADGVFIVLEGHVVLRNKIKVGRGFVPVILISASSCPTPFVPHGICSVDACPAGWATLAIAEAIC